MTPVRQAYHFAHPFGPQRIVGMTALVVTVIASLAITCGLAFSQATAAPQAGKKAPTKSDKQVTYDLIKGVDCQVEAKVMSQDAYGHISAEGVQLLCDGQLIPLIDGKLANTWLATADFGKIKVEKPPYWPALLVYVTPDQNRKIQAFLAPMADLTSASHHGDIARVKSLLAAHADPNAKNAESDAALNLASREQHLDVVRALLAAGADVNARGQIGDTALIDLLRACSAKTFELTQVLLSAKADVNAAEADGVTALIAASRCNDPRVVRALLAAGADGSRKADNGDTAVTLASTKGYRDIVHLLENAALFAPISTPEPPSHGGFKQAEHGMYLTVVVDVNKRVGGDTYLGERQLFLEANRIEWDKTGRIIALYGIKPNVKNNFYDHHKLASVPQDDLTIVPAVGKLLAKDGAIIELRFSQYPEHTLSFSMKFDDPAAHVTEAEWLLPQ